jgi:hypothetical protein
MINIRIIENKCLLMLIVIDAGRSMLCAAAETHRRGIVHIIEIIHRA